MSDSQSTHSRFHSFLNTGGPGRTVQWWQAGQTIFAQGDDCGAIFWLQSGRVQRTVHSRNARDVIVDIVTAGDFLGTCGLAGEVMRTDSAFAMEPCVTTAIHLQALREASEARPQLCALLLQSTTCRAIRVEAELFYRTRNTVKPRLARALLKLADEDGRIARTQEWLADLLGVTRNAITIGMQRLMQDGAIEYERGNIVVRRDALLVILEEGDAPNMAPRD